MVVEKGYKLTEVGVIPEDWEVAILANLTNKIGDGLHSSPKYDIYGDYYFINGNNLLNGKIFIYDDTKRVSQKEYSEHKRDLNDTTILLSINGTIGNIAIYNNEKVLIGKSAAYLNQNERIKKNFLYHILQANFLKKYFENELTGSTIKNLGLTSIRQTPLPLPPLHEQTAIATALS